MESHAMLPEEYVKDQSHTDDFSETLIESNYEEHTQDCVEHGQMVNSRWQMERRTTNVLIK